MPLDGRNSGEALGTEGSENCQPGVRWIRSRSAALV